MAINFQIEKYKYPDNGKVIEIFRVKPPHDELNVITSISNLDDLDEEINFIKQLIDSKIPDFSNHNGILNQGILYGSSKSKIIENTSYGAYIEKEEFYTEDLLTLFYEWRKFIFKRIGQKK